MGSRRWLATLMLVLACIVGFVAWRWRSDEESVARDAQDAAHSRDAGVDVEEPRLELTLAPHVPTSSRIELNVDNAVTGRVVDAQSGAGLAGFWVKLYDGRAQIADTSSDDLGWFKLPPPPAPRGKVIVKPVWGWFVVDATQTVEARDDHEYAPLVFHARPASSAKLRAQLFDAQTGELVPHYLVDVATRESGHEQLLSDAQGIFETRSEYPEGVLRLTFNDIIPPDEGANERRACYQLELDFSGSPSDPPRPLQIPVGPTYFIELEAPPEVDPNTLSVLLRGDMKQEELEQLPSGVRTPLRVDDIDPQHPSALAWARFRPETANWERYYERLTLGVRSRDGLWYGSATVDSTTGIYPRRVAIALEARGHMLGRVRETAGAPIAGALVSLRALEQREAGHVLATMTSSGNGLFEFELLPLGRYLVSAISAQHDAASVEVSVIAGRRTEPEIALDRAPIGGPISGRLVALEQPTSRGIKIAIASLNPSGRSLTQTIAFRLEHQRWIGEFRFDEVPAGDYALRLYNTSIDEWTPQRMLVSPPAEGLEFAQLGPQAILRVEFIAVDAQTGAVVSAYRAKLLSSGASDYTEELDNEWRWIEHLGELDSGARWMVAADGYAPVYGTRADLTGLPAQPLARAALERGWGAEIAAFGPHFTHLEGVAISLDGELAGTTGADGRLRLVRATKPRRVLATYRNWRVDDDALDDLSSDLRANELSLVLFMAPP